jgi:hypothetical protein
VVKLIGGGSVINGAYLGSLLVLKGLNKEFEKKQICVGSGEWGVEIFIIVGPVFPAF